MPVIRSTFSVLLLTLGLAACGGAETAASPTDTSSDTPASVEKVSSDSSNTPAPSASETSNPVNVASEPKPVYVDGYLDLAWEELLPEGEEEKLAQMYQQQMALLYSSPVAEGSAADKAMQIGTFNVVDELDGKKVRLPGFTVPFEYGSDANIKEFLLVPYFGACLHAPPPPPNQTIFVSTDDAIKLKDLAQAVWVYGELQTARENTELADAAYTIVMERIEDYEY